jgi:hypothetical protein
MYTFGAALSSTFSTLNRSSHSFRLKALTTPCHGLHLEGKTIEASAVVSIATPISPFTEVIMRAYVSLFLALALLAPSISHAQSPYSPIPPDTSKLMTTGRFERSPLRLPFPQDNVNMVNRNSRMDFEHVYNIPITQLIQWLRDAKNQREGFDIIDASVYPAASGLRLKLSTVPEVTGGSIVFEHPTLSRRVILEVQPRGSQTVVIFQNQVITDLFSGVMPARQGFLPAGTNTIVPFRWN